jgi:pyruvate formate lyase activating enzyme
MVQIKGFLETSFLDWPGRICAVLFLPYCNFRCPYCHNHPLVMNPDRYPSLAPEEVIDRLHPYREWIDGVCVTGGEPTLHPELPVLIGKIRRHRFAVKLDTNGSNPDMLERLIEGGQIDSVAMDVKAPLDRFHYRRAAGVSVDLERIVRSIEILKRGKVEYQFRMTVVPGLHREEDIRSLGNRLRAGERLVLQNFNPENPLDSSLRETQPYDPIHVKRMEREVQKMV